MISGPWVISVRLGPGSLASVVSGAQCGLGHNYIAKKSFSRLKKKGVAGLTGDSGNHSFSRSKKSSTFNIKRRRRTHQTQNKMQSSKDPTVFSETPRTVHKSSRQENQDLKNEVKEIKNEVIGATRR